VEKDPSMEKKKLLQYKTMMIKDQEEVVKTYNWIVKKEHEEAIKYVVYSFIGLNNRHNEFNRKYILDHFIDDIVSIYDFGQFYFKYIMWYFAPIPVTLVEVKELESKIEKLIPNIDPEKKQLINGIKNLFDETKLKRKIFEKAAE